VFSAEKEYMLFILCKLLWFREAYTLLRGVNS